MKNTFGEAICHDHFGESLAGPSAVLDLCGMAAGVPVEEDLLAACMDKHCRARGDGLPPPCEGIRCSFYPGVVNSCTTGTATRSDFL